MYKTFATALAISFFAKRFYGIHRADHAWSLAGRFIEIIFLTIKWAVAQLCCFFGHACSGNYHAECRM